MANRIFLIVLDSVGVGEAPDAATYGDVGSNTLRACFRSGHLSIPTMQNMGIFNIDGVDCGEPLKNPSGCYGRMREASAGKDTTIGHWEIGGVISPRPMPVFPDGFPDSLIQKFKEKTGRDVLCNKPYSGTQVILDYGQQHEQTGALIVYTSADSVFQIAAHESVVPPEQLYQYCKMARELLTGDFAVGRVIARPFEGVYPDYKRTSNRHDFSLTPPKDTLLDHLMKAGLDTIGVGKISDIFAGRGVSRSTRTLNNIDGMEKTIEIAKSDFHGLCFVNLVDFDMIYGHRNDVEGYTKALNQADMQLAELVSLMRPDDVLMITADHGCDPSTESTDHSREYTPWIIYGDSIKSGINLGTRSTFADIAATALDLLGVEVYGDGTSAASLIRK